MDIKTIINELEQSYEALKEENKSLKYLIEANTEEFAKLDTEIAELKQQLKELYKYKDCCDKLKIAMEEFNRIYPF